MVHTRFGRALAARDVDHVAIGVGGEPGQIAGVVVAELARSSPYLRPLRAQRKEHRQHHQAPERLDPEAETADVRLPGAVATSRGPLRERSRRKNVVHSFETLSAGFSLTRGGTGRSQRDMFAKRAVNADDWPRVFTASPCCARFWRLVIVPALAH